jgi:galactose oxidase
MCAFALPRRINCLPAALLLSLTVSGCHDASEEPRPLSETPTEIDDDSDQPIRLSYVCGNRFVVVNSYSVPISLGWRVAQTDEEGSTTVAGADTTRHPSAREQLVETRSTGTLELFMGDRRIKTRSNGGIPCAPAEGSGSFASATAAESGAWSAVVSWPIVAVHINLMPNGKVLAWGSKESGLPQVWDPATNSFTPYPSPVLLFCAGHSFLADGRLLVIGGHIKGDHGLPDVTVFNQTTGWSSLPKMPRGRWYPTATTMANGEVLALAGLDQQALQVTVPELWSPSTGLRSLTGASLALPYYPTSFLAPNGKLFVAGEQQMSRYLDVTGAGKWTDAGMRTFGTRDQGSAVMYGEGRVLYAGGGRTTNTAETVNLKRNPIQWVRTGSMAFARRHHNLTVLPTGDVLVTGGTAGTDFNDLTTMVRAAEIWNPTTGVWTTMASSSVDRAYHSVALLLPDGRVLQTGGGAAAAVAPNQLNAQYFSPPYLFGGARPVISSVPTSLRFGQSFRITTSQASRIAKVTLIRTGSVTHGFDMNQRFRQFFTFTKDATGLTMTGITNANLTPPGYYMMFIVDTNGIPSVGKIVKIS